MSWTLETVGTVAMALAIVGTVMNARRRRGCFYVWLWSNALTFGLHVHLAAWSLAARDVVFFALAIYGLAVWPRDNRQGREEARELRRMWDSLSGMEKPQRRW